MEDKIKKEAKKVDKKFVVAIVLCVTIVLGVIGIAFLPEPITAAVKLNELKKFVTSSTDEVIIVVNSPTETEGILNNKETVIRENDALELVEKISLVLENIKYSNTEGADIGVWKTKITIYNATDKMDIYIDTDGIYIENKGKIIKYTVSDKGYNEYDKLCKEIRKILG